MSLVLLNMWQNFLRELSDLELVQLIHNLREHPKDHEYLKMALVEMGFRNASAEWKSKPDGGL
jgi:hypothetical protein